MGRYHILFFVFAVCAMAIAVSGCESTDDNNVAKAQKCLDGLGESPSPTEAQTCLNPISGDYSANAEVVRCAADFIVGGITDSSLINAYQTIKNSNLSGNSVAQTLIPDLSQDTTDHANTTYNDCVNSGTPSLVYLAGLSQVGTIMAVAAGSPANAATFCSGSPSSCSPSTIGTIAQTVTSNYCNGSNQNSDVCTTLNNAIAQGNGDPNSIGTYLLQNL